MRNQIHTGDQYHIGESAPDERRALQKRAQAGNAGGGNTLHRAPTIKCFREVGGEKRRLDLALGDGGNRQPADKIVERLDVRLRGRKDKTASLGRNRTQNAAGNFSGFAQRGGGEKKGARVGVSGIGGAQLRHGFVWHKAGDDALAGFADAQFPALQSAAVRLHRALQQCQAESGGADRAAAGDGNGAFVHGCFQSDSHEVRRSSMKSGQFKISSPVGVVKTWLVLPVASRAASLSRRIS